MHPVHLKNRCFEITLKSLNLGANHVTGSVTEHFWAMPTHLCEIWVAVIFTSPLFITLRHSGREGEQTHVSQATNCSAEITIGNSRSQEFAHRHWKIITSKSILSRLNLLGDKSGTEQMLYLTAKWFTKYSVPRSMQKSLGCCERWLFFCCWVGGLLALYRRQDHYYFLVTGLVPIPLKSMTNFPFSSMKDVAS